MVTADPVQHAEPYDLDGIFVPTPSLEDLIRSRAAEHPRTAKALAALRELVVARRRRK